jgi:ABC-type sugar transport system permease subunit
VLNQFIVDEAFNSWQFGVAASASMVLFVIILVITIVQLRVLQPRAEQ